MAVKVTLLPLQIAPDGFAAIITPAATLEITDIVIALEVAGEPETQVALLVITQVMISLFARVEALNVVFVAPAIFDPFFFH